MLSRYLRGLAAASCAMLASMSGCSSRPSLRCEVDLDDAAHGLVTVSCRARGLREDTCRIKTMAQDEALRVRDFTVSDATGSPLSFDARADTDMGSEARRFTERDVELKGAHGFDYRYRVEPGAPTGTDIRGHDGRRLGYLDDQGGLLSGRNLFLLPASYPELSTIDVQFRLPDGWRVVGDLPLREGRARLRGAGQAATTLIQAILGIGRFSERQAGSGDSVLHMFARQDMPRALVDSTFESLDKGFGFLQEHLGPLGHDYSVVLVPPAPDGTMILVTQASTGLGVEIAGAGPVQSSELLLSMARAWVAFPDSPVKIAARDAWLKEALPAYEGVRAADALGVRPARLGWLLYSTGGRQAFVSLYPDAPSERESDARSRLLKGMILLAYSDRRLRDGQGAARSLDQVVERLRNDSGNRGFFTLLGTSSTLDWKPVENVASAASSIPADWIEAINGTSPLSLTPEPVPAPGGAAGGRRLTLLVTGNTRGMLEVCGCVARQTGGIARRETLRRRILGQGTPVALVSLGNSYLLDSQEPLLTSASLKELEVGQELMGRQDYAAAAIGDLELFRGPGFFQETAGRHPLPYVNGNLTFQGRPLAPPWKITRAGGLRIAWISALDPGHYSGEHPRFYEEHLGRLQTNDPLASLKDAAREVRPRADLVVAIGSLPPDLVRGILDTIPEVDAILSTEATQAATNGLLRFDTGDEQRLIGFAGNRLVYFSTGDGKWLEEIDLTLAPDARIRAARLQQHMLTEDVSDDPSFRRRLAAFYDAMKDAPDLARTGQPVARALPALLKADYVGGFSCRTCHVKEAADWDNSPHGSAFSVLLARHRNYAPRCVACHVTGFGYPTGYRLGDPLERLRHVQCEMCHGPGSLHAARPTAANIVRRPPREACFECHTPDHSLMDESNYPDYYVRSAHGHTSADSATSAR